jgi:hypothetical protein
MASLSPGWAAPGGDRTIRGFLMNPWSQKLGQIAAAGAAVIVPHRLGHGSGIELLLAGEKFEQQFGQPAQGDAVGRADAVKQPIAPLQK